MARRGRGRGRVVDQCQSGTSRNYSESRQADLIPSKSHFSLSEEARNTERHHSWNPDLKLRHSRITFVSAGTSKAEDLTQLPQENKSQYREHLQAPTESTDAGFTRQFKTSVDAPLAAPVVSMAEMTLSEFRSDDAVTGDHKSMSREMAEQDVQDEAPSQDLFFTDTKGSPPPMQSILAPPVLRRSLSMSPDSGDEVILFTGRSASSKQASKSNRPFRKPKESQRDASRMLSKSTETSRKLTAQVVNDPVKATVTTGCVEKTLPSRSNVTVATSKSVGGPSSPRHREIGAFSNKDGRRQKVKRSKKAVEDAVVLDDYISSVNGSEGPENFVDSFPLYHRNLGNSDADEWQDDEGLSTAESLLDIFRKGTVEWDSADLGDFDNFSTSSEAPGKVEQILSKRERPSGIQYLVFGEGCTVDDAQWLPLSTLQARGEDEQIRIFNERRAESKLLFGSSDDSDDTTIRDEQIALDLQRDLDDLEDERDLEERRKARMTDEQIARLLSKQEELGLGSNDLVLFDGEDDTTNELEDAQLDGSWERPLPIQPQFKSKQKKRSRPMFPSATAFADVLDQDPYDGFDVMDQERPSLRKRPKGRRGKAIWELSDSDLEQSINMAWENDRTKKKLRKQEREELRAQGLLGKKGKVDMKAKYCEGMSMDEVKTEIRDFLLSSIESLSLPPMAQKERKIVHEIANVFKLKSKSTGSGKSRFPVLYKTARTLQYDELALSTIDATLSSRRFLPRMDKTKKRGALTGKARGGFASAGVSYRDGEVVGATAPELGQENRGRAMLEKMGWSTGTVLGALNNTRGIVQPVTQVVKTGKAGLG